VQRGFEQQWLSITFSKAVFLGNGLVAIISGLFGNVLVDTLALGPVAPFDAASCFLAIGMAIILSSWSENYGDPSESKDLLAQFRGAAVAITSGKVPILSIHSFYSFKSNHSMWILKIDLQDYINLDSASRWTHLLMIPPCNQLCHSTLVQKIIILMILKHVLRQSCLLWQAVDLDSN
jgi:hypothetical protein